MKFHSVYSSLTQALAFGIMLLCFSCKTEVKESVAIPYAEIQANIAGMEKAFGEKRLKDVAGFYAKDGIMLSPGGNKSIGEKAMVEYWTGIENPVSWKLESWKITNSLDSIFATKGWKTLPTKIELWGEDEVAIYKDRDPIYQIGRSNLSTLRKGKESTSVVNFVLVWCKENEAYKICLDVYAPHKLNFLAPQ